MDEIILKAKWNREDNFRPNVGETNCEECELDYEFRSGDSRRETANAHNDKIKFSSEIKFSEYTH